MSTNNTQVLGVVFVILSILLLVCCVYNCGGKKYIDGMRNSSRNNIGGLYFNGRSGNHQVEGLHDMVTVTPNKHSQFYKKKPYVDLKWKTEGLVGLNNYEELSSATDLTRLNQNVSGELITIAPNQSKQDCSCNSVGGVMLKNVDYNPNGSMFDMQYAENPKPFYVTI